ncbi:MAG: serine/threonine-protein kinase [Nannocystaceae bacterium]|nr:serine/threonine-protein kinase [Nannocystaceae bacterium]
MNHGSDDEPSTAGPGPQPDAERSGDELPRGASVGRYVVIERLGRGGMATVYRAYDPKLRRDVALKMLRRDLVDALGEARLVAEAQAMARLSHANVVVIYDVIAARNGVVFAMELVDGGTLSQWLEAPRPSRRVLETFVAAGRGLATAHRAGLIHRDFKPANVVLGPDDVPKVADFGLAIPGADARSSGDATSSPGSCDTPARSDGVVGTPRYMAPEQLDGAAIDERADQYAFCVSLWEALARRRLFDGERAALRAAKQQPIPPLPPAARVPPAIARAITRGLAVDPAARWPSMDALLTALVEQPARARRRRLWIATAVVGAPLAVAAAMSLRPSARCEQLDRLTGVWEPGSRTAAPGSRRAKLDAELDAYAQAWIDHQRDACEATWVQKRQSVAQLDLRMACLWDARARLAAAIEVVGDDDAPAASLELVAKLPPLDRCDDVAQLEARAGPAIDPQRSAAIDAVRQELARAGAHTQLGHHDRAEPIAAAARERARSLGDPSLQVEAAVALGSVRARLGRYAEAEADLVEGLDVALASGDRLLELDATTALAFHLVNEAAAPERAYWPAVIAAGLAESDEVDPARAAEAFSAQGAMLRGQGRYDASERAHRRALALRIAAFGEDDFRTGAARTNLGLVLYDRGDLLGAVEQHAAALEVWRQGLGDDHPRVAAARGNLGNALEGAGRYEEAVTELRAALELRLALVGPDHADVGVSRNDLGIALTSAQQYALAEQEIAEAVRIWTNSHGAESRLVALGYNNLGLALEGQHRIEEAGAAFRRSAALVERILGPRHPLLPRILANAARTAHGSGDDEQAESLYQRALELHQAVVDDDDVAAARMMTQLCDVRASRGAIERARPMCDRAAAILSAAGTDGEAKDRAELDAVRARHGLASDAATKQWGRAARPSPPSETRGVSSTTQIRTGSR